MTELDRLLTEGRLLTLLGPGGVGKTTLVQHFGLTLTDRFGGGVWFVDLAGCENAHEVGAAVAAALDLPLGRNSALVQLGLALAEWAPTLLILDNAEQAIAPVAKAVRMWLGRAANVRFMVTSRIPLNLAGEFRFDVEPLAEDDGVSLLEERIRSAGGAVESADRTALAELVRRLDGIPLALELAAGRLGVFTPTELLGRLEQRFKLLRTARKDVEERHATLWGAIDWSWQLLEPWEADALAQVSVFRGGFTLEAAEATIEVDEPTAWVPDILQSLREQNLLRSGPAPGFADETRFHLYHSVIEYVESRKDLKETVSEATERHAVWALGEAERWRVHAEAEGIESEALRRLAVEMDNVLAVYRNSMPASPETALRALLALDPLMQRSGATRLQLDRLNHVLTRIDDIPEPLRTRGRISRSLAALWCGKAKAARTELESVLSSGSPSPELVCRALLCLSQAAFHMDQHQWAAQAGKEALEVAASEGDKALQAKAHTRIAAALTQQDPTAAKTHYKEAVRLEKELGRRLGDSFQVAAHLATSLTEPTIAIGLMGEWLSITSEIGAAVGSGQLLDALAATHARVGNLDAAEELTRRALEAAERAGSPTAIARQRAQLARVLHGKGKLDEASEMYDAAAQLAGEHTVPLLSAAIRTDRASLIHERGDAQTALVSHDRALDVPGATDTAALAGTIQVHRAAALAELGRTEEARAAVSEARTLLADSPEHTVSVDVVATLLGGAPPRVIGLEARVAEGLVRAIRERVSPAAPASAALQVSKDGRFFEAAGVDGAVDLTRRRAMRLILRHLVQERIDNPGVATSLYDLVDVGWPDEHPLPEAGANRVYSAIRNLRNIGLKEYVLRMDDGYLVDPDASVEWRN